MNGADDPVTTSSASWWLRLLAVLAAAVLVWRLVDLVVSLTIAPGYTRAGHVARALGTSLGVGAIWLLALRRPPRRAEDYGVRFGRSGWRAAAAGALAYLVPWVLGSMIVIVTASVEVRAPSGVLAVLGQLAALMILVLLFEAIPEELVFRGLLYGTLAERLPRWAAVIGQAALFCLFGALIGAALTLDRQILFALFSLALGVVRAVTGSVLATIGFHAAFQAVVQLLINGNWDAVEVLDPERWYADVAVGLLPLVVGPMVLVVWWRWTQARRLAI